TVSALSCVCLRIHASTLFFFHAPSPTAIYTLSLHDALPISTGAGSVSTGSSVPFTPWTGSPGRRPSFGCWASVFCSGLSPPMAEQPAIARGPMSITPALARATGRAGEKRKVESDMVEILVRTAHFHEVCFRSGLRRTDRQYSAECGRDRKPEGR